MLFFVVNCVNVAACVIPQTVLATVFLTNEIFLIAIVKINSDQKFYVAQKLKYKKKFPYSMQKAVSYS